jgi:hypothetical protein
MALAVVLVAGVPSAAAAQPAPVRFVLSIGGLWHSGVPLGSRDAIETRNQVGGGAFVLFETESAIMSGAGLIARIGVRLAPAFTIEMGGTWTKTSISTRLTADAEAAPDSEIRSNVTEYVLGAALVFRLERLAMAGGRAVPFVEAGAGYLRQLHGDNRWAKTGSVLHGGGGLVVWLRSDSNVWLKRLGVRIDGRITARKGGVEPAEGRQRVFAALGAGLAFVF